MAEIVNVQSVVTAIVVAIIFAFAKLFRDVNDLKITVKPVVDWYVKTSMDALKIATNPTSERLTELANRYVAHVNEGKPMAIGEKEELIDGLKEVMNDQKQYASKRQSASMSLRFIEAREGLTAKIVGAGH